jgi:hypothetical protein
MFIDEKLPEVKIEEDGVRVALSHPYKYPEEITEVFIPYLKVSHFRKLKSRQLELADEIAILLELTGMSTNELEMMHVQDFSVCLGVVQGFFLQFHQTTQLYYNESTKLMVRRLSKSLTDSVSPT